ncbi:MAG: glycosyltransferase family 2 protein [Lachnospiraceae bacterium]|nr:glycosyltransferase family 2 protein [Lachnospiraceae bacterium]
MNENQCELTILMPCLNEAETLQTCIEKAQAFLSDSGIQGEILIADNGSDDGSQDIARRLGARVADIAERGYGAALIGGTKAAAGKYVIMGDADDSYDFLHLAPFVDKLREGYDLVMGNRFKGGIAKGAMPPLHKYLGNPVLSFIGRLFYSSDIGDFHCGLRGYNRERMLALHLQTTGMEYASEMVVRSTLAGYKIAEVPTTLKKDGRSRPPHLRSFSDGWRHLKFLLMYSPDWLFLYPGFLLFAIGLVLTVTLEFGDLIFPGFSLGIHTLLYACAAMSIGVNIIFFGVYTKVYAYQTQFIPRTKSMERLVKFSVDKGVFWGFLLILAGLIVSLVAVFIWGRGGFMMAIPEQLMRLTIPALALIQIGVQLVFSSFFVGILQIKRKPVS